MYLSFIESSDVLGTDEEILEAILALAQDDEEAFRIWEAPTDRELLSIWETVTKNGRTPSEEFCWGAAGPRWWPYEG